MENHNVTLTNDERCFIIRCLFRARNELISQGGKTDLIDEIIIKLLE